MFFFVVVYFRNNAGYTIQAKLSYDCCKLKKKKMTKTLIVIISKYYLIWISMTKTSSFFC